MLLEHEEADILEIFERLGKEIHETALSKGWNNRDNDGQMVALIHSEVSEVLEAIRHGNPPDDKIPEFTGAEAEMADVIIRVIDACRCREWRLGPALLAKMAFNKTRAFKHGGKAF